MAWHILVLCLGLTMSTLAQGDEGSGLSLAEILKQVSETNASLGVARAQLRAREAEITEKSSFADPVIGYQKLNRGNETEYLTIQQQIRFPVKYFKEANHGEQVVNAAKAQEVLVGHQVRGRAIRLFYQLYSLRKIRELMDANRNTVREFARVAERKYSSGKGGQHHSMKAHVELTRLEIEILELDRKMVEVKEALVTLTSSTLADQRWAKLNVEMPKYDQRRVAQLLGEQEINFPRVVRQKANLDAAEAGLSRARWEWAPDFVVSYQTRISGLPEDAEMAAVGVKVPLWFWKRSASVDKASAEKRVKSEMFRHEQLLARESLKALLAKLKKEEKVFKIFKTSLIPQAETTYKLAGSAYRSGKGSFLDFLDSERVYYGIRADFYKSISRFAEVLAQLEELTGQQWLLIGKGESK